MNKGITRRSDLQRLLCCSDFRKKIELIIKKNLKLESEQISDEWLATISAASS